MLRCYPPLALFCCCEGEKQLSSDGGLPPLLSGNLSVFFLMSPLLQCNHCLFPSFLPEVHVEPHKKQLHVTLAYHFQASHLPTLEKLAQNIDVKLGCDWVATIFSRDIRFANHEVMSHCGTRLYQGYWGAISPSITCSCGEMDAKGKQSASFGPEVHLHAS